MAKEQNKKLKQIEGIKIREQFFNDHLRFALNLLIIFIIVSIEVCIKNYDLFCELIICFDIAVSGFDIIMYLIEILNRNFFGKLF